MRKFVPYQIIYVYTFYLENLVHRNAAFGWNQYKSISKLIGEKIKINTARPGSARPLPRTAGRRLLPPGGTAGASVCPPPRALPAFRAYKNHPIGA
jgi:hypothetical protein